MKENFEKSVTFVLSKEGGLTDDPRDPGGLTNFGISKRSYPELDIKNLSIIEAHAIYKRDYWDKVGGDDLPWPLDIVIFDTAVNCGRGRAISMQQGTTGWEDYLLKRISYYIGLPTSKIYLRGWVSRVLGLWALIKKGG